MKTFFLSTEGSIRNRMVLLFVFLLFIAGNIVTAQPRVAETIIESQVESERGPFRLVQVVQGLEHPWAMAWLPDGRMLISERPGFLYLMDGNTITPLEGLPVIHGKEDSLTAPQGGQQGGLLDLAVHPDYEQNGWIYMTYSSPGDADGITDPEAGFGTGTALARARLNDQGTGLTDLETLYTQIPRTEPGRHYGSRIVFPGDGTVIFSIGDRGLRHPAQDLTHPAGSMIRLQEDGGAAPDNPFVEMAPGNLRPEIWSFGHRNNQGLAINPENGDLWTTEHGPNGGDLLHKIEKGSNYGWPQVAFGTEYSTNEHIGIGRSAPGVMEPVYIWEDNMAPSGLTFYTGESFPEWQGNLLAGALLKEEIYRIELENDQVTHIEPLITGMIGRIRDVRQGPDGLIYIATDEEDGGIYRLEPKED